LNGAQKISNFEIKKVEKLNFHFWPNFIKNLVKFAGWILIIDIDKLLSQKFSVQNN